MDSDPMSFNNQLARIRAVEAQRELDNKPCPNCGGDRLRTDFRPGGCHVGGSLSQDSELKS